MVSKAKDYSEDVESVMKAKAGKSASDAIRALEMGSLHLIIILFWHYTEAQDIDSAHVVMSHIMMQYYAGDINIVDFDEALAKIPNDDIISRLKYKISTITLKQGGANDNSWKGK